MRRVRKLLVAGNRKLGKVIHHWDLPAVVTCPGRSSVCERICYATRGRFLSGPLRRRLAWCHRQSLKPDFAPRMVQAIRADGVLVVRIHVAGDFYNSDYAWKWLEVVQACPQVRFFAYTRSWRVPTILSALEELARVENMVLWFSTDAATGAPSSVPGNVRLAYLQHDGQAPDRADLVFRVSALRRTPRIGLPMVCPQEVNGAVNCGNCQHCFRG